MALESPAYVISADEHGAQLFRLAAQSLFGGAGVLSVDDLAIVQHGAGNMSVDVNPGNLWIPGTLGSSIGQDTNYSGQTAFGLPQINTSQGSYFAFNDGAVNLAIATASGSNPRIDLVCASIEDAEYAGSLNTPLLSVVTGTAAASPVAPSPPDSSCVLASVLVGTSVTSILTGAITDTRPFCVVAGSTLSKSPSIKSIVSTPTCGPTPTQDSYIETGITLPNVCTMAFVTGLLLYSDSGHTTPVDPASFAATAAPPGAGPNVGHVNVTFQNFTGDTVYPLIQLFALGY